MHLDSKDTRLRRSNAFNNRLPRSRRLRRRHAGSRKSVFSNSQCSSGRNVFRKRSRSSDNSNNMFSRRNTATGPSGTATHPDAGAAPGTATAAQQRVQAPQLRPQEQQRSQQPRERDRPQQTVQGRPFPQQGAPQQYRPPQRSQQQAQAWQQQHGWQRGGAWQGGRTFQQDRAQHWSNEHRTWSQRGGYGGYYIPPDRFSLYFGPRHYFRIGVLPSIYMGYPRFQYGGYTFLLLDPYPEYWPPDWYLTDELYIDYDEDGYYLVDNNYPDVRLAVTVEL